MHICIYAHMHIRSDVDADADADAIYDMQVQHFICCTRWGEVYTVLYQVRSSSFASSCCYATY